MTHRVLLLACLFFAACGGCGGPPAETGDAGAAARDAAPLDSAVDAGAALDAGAGDTDAAAADGAAADAGSAIDAATAGDASSPDTSQPDAWVDPTTSLSGPLGSGIRIQTDLISSGGGPETVVGYYDTLRAEACELRVASDGQLRCLPSSAYTASRFSFFRDDACTEPVHLIASNDPCAPLPYVRVSDSAACPPLSSVYPIGSALPEQDPIYVRENDGSCQASSITSSRPHTLSAEIPASEFAAAAIVELARSNDIVVELLQTDDGARAFHRLALAASGDTCVPAPADDGSPRCLSSGISVSAYYADSSCGTALGSVSATARCAPPGHAYEQGSGCNPTRTMREVTGDFEGQAYRISSSTEECVTTSSATALVSIGEVAPAATFPETPEETGPGGRLVERRYVVADGVAQRISLYDTTLGADCTFLPDSAGDLRCVPYTAGTVVAGVYYRDVGCSIPLVSDANPCPNTYAVQITRSEDCTPSRYEVYAVGPAYSGSIYYKSGGFCSRATAPWEFGLAFFSRGQRVAPEDMVLGTLERR